MKRGQTVWLLTNNNLVKTKILWDGRYIYVEEFPEDEFDINTGYGINTKSRIFFTKEALDEYQEDLKDITQW